MHSAHNHTVLSTQSQSLAITIAGEITITVLTEKGTIFCTEHTITRAICTQYFAQCIIAQHSAHNQKCYLHNLHSTLLSTQSQSFAECRQSHAPFVSFLAAHLMVFRRVSACRRAFSSFNFSSYDS